MKKHSAAFALAAILMALLMLGACASPNGGAAGTPGAAGTEAPAASPAETEASAEATASAGTTAPAETTTPAETAVSDGTEGVLSSFTATDTEGNTVDEAVLGGYTLTMVNIWATYCSPCIGEMPDLAKLSDDYAASGVQIIGVVSDAVSYDGVVNDATVESAKKLIEKTGAAYTHLIPSEDIMNALFANLSVVPTTIFVDSMGRQIGDEYLGSKSYDEWAAIIDELLLMMGGDPGESGACSTADPDGVVMPGG